MAPNSADNEESSEREVHSEKKTEVSFDGPGTVYAVKTVRQGDRRIDWKIGQVDGTYAEGADFYYKGELIRGNELQKMHENAPSGKYKEEKFHELLDFDIHFEDEKFIEKWVYDREGVDTTEWALTHLDTVYADEMLEWWDDIKSLHDEDE